jgi:CHAT domain-containing protein/Tfp pilus assembly protein PilF
MCPARSVASAVTVLLSLIAATTAAPQPPVPPAEPLGDRAVERELAPGQRHVYRIALDARQVVRVLVEPRAAMLEATLVAPGGETASKYHSDVRPEPLTGLAESSGEYRVVVGTIPGTTRPQRYRLSVIERRSEEPPDRQRASAERLFAEGLRLHATGTHDAMKAALRPLEEAVALWQSVGDRRLQSGVLGRLAEIQNQLGNPRAGLDYGQRALRLVEEAGDHGREADLRNIVGASCFYLQQWSEAVPHFERALALHRAAGYLPGVAEALHNLATVRDSRSEVSAALETYREALGILHELGDREKEASVLNAIGGALIAAGEPQAAYESLTAALAIRRGLKDRRLLAHSLHNVGALEHGLGRIREASTRLNEALTMWRAIGDTNGEGTTLTWLARVAQAAGQRQRALELVKAGLERSRAAGNRYGEAAALLLSAQLSREVGRQATARTHAESALTICRAMDIPRCESFVLTELGRVETAGGAFEEAAGHLRAALAIQRATSDAAGQILSTVALARLEEARGDEPAARAHAEVSIGLIEAMRGQLTDLRHRASLLAARYDAFELAIQLSMDMHGKAPDAGHAARAFEMNERSRARTLLDLLAEAGANIGQGVDPELLREERRLQQQLNALDTRRLLGIDRPGKKAVADSLGAETERVRLALEELRRQIRTRSPQYAGLTMPQPITSEVLQHDVLDDDTVLLQYSLGTRRSYLWAIDRRAIRSFTLPAKAEIEAGRVRQLLPFSGARSRRREAERALEELSRHVLGPVGALHARRVAIVADGALQFVPFAALPIDGKPLIDRAEIVHLPSATTLAMLRRDHTRRSPAAKLVAVFADPVLSVADARVSAAPPRRRSAGTARTATADTTEPPPAAPGSALARIARETGISRLDRLPFTRREARLIAALAGPSNASIALGFDASRDRALTGGLDGFRIVHFATHGLVNDLHPDLSGLVLSLVDQQGRPQDGFLRLQDIYNLRLDADLVVLSACRTALGEEIRGEGLVGLVRGFMYAGSARVVASLWDVRDEATAELMRRFYAAMIRDGLAPAAALRVAQLSMAQHPRWHAPYYWAGFVLQGDWRSLDANRTAASCSQCAEVMVPAGSPLGGPARGR